MLGDYSICVEELRLYQLRGLQNSADLSDTLEAKLFRAKEYLKKIEKPEWKIKRVDKAV